MSVGERLFGGLVLSVNSLSTGVYVLVGCWVSLVGRVAEDERDMR